MGNCVVCRKQTCKTLFKNAYVPTYIYSKECFAEYFKSLGKIPLQEGSDQTDQDKEYWLE